MVRACTHLDTPELFSYSGLPNNVRRNRRLLPVPSWQKKRFFLFLATIASFFRDAVMYW